METVIVLLILCLTAVVGVRAFYRIIKGKGSCSYSKNCQSCGNSKSDTK